MWLFNLKFLLKEQNLILQLIYKSTLQISHSRIDFNTQIFYMVLVVVDGKEYNIDQPLVKVMKYIQEAEGMEKGHNITITNISQKTFEEILDIIKVLNYDIKEPPKIKNNVVGDHIGKELAAFLEKRNAKELNQLYRAVHYLKIYPLRRCIAAVMACRVKIEPTLEIYNQKKQEIGLKIELTTEKSKQYKERFPFIN